jgi:Protein of unknown function (DUF3108)
MRSVEMPTKALSLLTAGVVVAHLLILLGTTNSLQATQRAAQIDARPFSTRSIALGPVQPPAVVTATTPSVPVARTVATAAPAPRPPKATPGRISAANTVKTDITDITTIGPAGGAATDPAAGPAGAAVEPVTSTFGNVTGKAPGAVAAVAAAKVAEAAAPSATAGSVNAAPQLAIAQPSSTASNVPAQLANTAYTVAGSTRLKYNVIATKGSLSFSARAELLWLQDGSTYDARLEVSAFPFGARIQSSTGRLTAQGLEPKRFADKFRTEVAAHFERDKRLVTFSANTPQVPLLTGMQDQLSVVMQLSAMIAGAPGQYPSGTAITFDTIGPRASEKWVLIVGEEEKLSLPGGELLALKLTRKPRGDYDQTLELWLAPQLAYLPARIKLTEKDGDYADQVWRGTEAP